MTRRLTTHDCGIRGCTQAEYRQGLCRAHYAMLPFSENRERMLEQMMRAHTEAQARRVAVVESLQSRLDQVVP